MVQAPFFPAEALVSWRRSGIVKTERISMKTRRSSPRCRSATHDPWT
jgi:hypothetical protein